jgi:hypothetical protein
MAPQLLNQVGEPSSEVQNMLVHHPLPMPSPTLAFGVPRAQFLLTGERRDHDSRERLLRRIREEFREMPCMRLTEVQSARLFGLSKAVCARILATLVREGTLWMGSDGRLAARWHE